MDIGLTMLSDMEPNWLASARQKWSAIEEVNAVTLDSPDRKLSRENMRIALKAADELERLVRDVACDAPEEQNY